jgi:hypothetical protein
MKTVTIFTGKRLMLKLSSRLLRTSTKALKFLVGRMESDGSLGAEADDLSCHYKLPTMLISAGKPMEADRVLNHIKRRYMLPSGDFMTSPETKSAKGEYAEFWGYTNGWIVRAAQACGRDDIAEPALAYLSRYRHPSNGGCLTHRVDEFGPDMTTDVLMTAHMGLVHLEGGRLDLAIASGDYLCRALEVQPNLKVGLYLRLDNDGNAITKYPEGMAPFMLVEKAKSNQLYFMVGYPIAYLTLLYEKTGDAKYLESAQAYADFALSCDKSVCSSNFSHKLAWALSLLYKHTDDERYIEAIDSITEHFELTQGADGIWYYPDDINTAFDQSAEITGWLIEIGKSLGLIATSHPFLTPQ